MADEYLKPTPSPTRDTQPYWDGLNEGKLLIQKCGKCGKLRHYPRPLCDACYSFDVAWVEASGNGKVHSWTVTHHPFNMGFKRELPYALATVDLAEGVRMQAQLRDVPAEKIAIGLPVSLRVERAKDDLTLPYFVPA
jgi:uncharacterized OB-fold protein